MVLFLYVQSMYLVFNPVQAHMLLDWTVKRQTDAMADRMNRGREARLMPIKRSHRIDLGRLYTVPFVKMTDWS
jgi:hypothetical protein